MSQNDIVYMQQRSWVTSYLFGEKLVTCCILLILLFQIAERLKSIGEELDKDVQKETKLEFMKLFQSTSVFTLSRENFRAACASIMTRYRERFTSGWHQIAFVYNGEISNHYKQCISIPLQPGKGRAYTYIFPSFKVCVLFMLWDYLNLIKRASG